MPVVPIHRGKQKGAAPQAMPNEASLLMALAEMHKLGRIPQSPTGATPALPAKDEE